MEINIYRANNNLYIEILGRVVLDVCDSIKNAVMPLIDKGINQVYSDLCSVDFIDSAGLGVLVGLKVTSNKNKARLVLVAPSSGVMDILNVSKLDKIFDIITGSEADLLKQSLALKEYLIKNISIEEPLIRKPATPPSVASENASQRKAASAAPVVKQPAPAPAAPDAPAVATDSLIPMPAAAKSVKDQVDEHCRRAVELMRQGDYEKAVEKYVEALKIDPDYLPAYNNLAIVYEKRPSWRAKAIETWERVLELSQAVGDQKHIDRAQKHLSGLKTSF
ncbi:anti-sigma factor antagonist [Candidatus Sumerlaeota bacterium]|nr:anti-sigma factor antagonist [Candidatus Sumerlaeota bacterium]